MKNARYIEWSAPVGTDGDGRDTLHQRRRVQPPLGVQARQPFIRVRVRIDEPGGNDQSRGIDATDGGGAARDGTDEGNAIATNADVRHATRCAGAVVYHRAGDQHVDRALSLQLHVVRECGEEDASQHGATDG